MGLLIANDNLLTALGITNKEQFDLTFADFSEFETFVEKCGYEYDFDEEGNLILITPKSKEINTGIVVKKDYSKIPFYIEALEDGELKFLASSFDFNNGYIKYSLDGVNYIDITGYGTYQIKKGDIMYFAIKLIDNFLKNILYIGNNGCLNNVGGNLLSLKYGLDFVNVEDTIPGENLFYEFNKKVVDASKLVIPMKDNSYGLIRNMFRDCTSLTTPPELPATTLSNYCYARMFVGCTSLTTPPELPATTLANNCYDNMFSGCTSLTTAPELPATGTANYCYARMFEGCTSLTTVPGLYASTYGGYAIEYMFSGCTSLNYIKYYGSLFSGALTTFSNISETGRCICVNNEYEGYLKDYLPSGWTVETADS